MESPCLSESCETMAYARGLCRKHYFSSHRTLHREKRQEYAAAYRKKNAVAVAAGKKKAYLAKKEYYQEYSRKHYAKNASVRSKATSDYRKANPDRSRQYTSKYKKRNPAKDAALAAKRRAAKAKAAPPWMTQTDFAQIEAMYTQARETQRKENIPMAVDHIIPLQGRESCGLHVVWNLCVLPADINERKHNSLPPKEEWQAKGAS